MLKVLSWDFTRMNLLNLFTWFSCAAMTIQDMGPLQEK